MIRPLSNRVLVRRDSAPDISPGGIALLPHIDTNFVKDVVAGEVIAVGPGAFDKKGQRETMWGLKSGDRINFSPVGAVAMQEAGLFMIARDAVIGVIEDKAAA